MESGAARFPRATGIGVEVVVTGPTHDISGLFRRGEADLVTMHASDETINIGADAVTVLGRVIASGSRTLHDLLAAGNLELDLVVSLPVDHHCTLLERAAAERRR